MEQKKRYSKKVATIRIEPYLAEYVSAKYGVDSKTGGVKIPPMTDLYHCVWEHMAHQRNNQNEPDNGNLRISLPCRKARVDGQTWKDPAYFNYLSRNAAREVESCIRRMFNFELHRALMENEEFGKERRNLDVIRDFIKSYQLRSISEDALLKNYYRFRNRLRPKKTRKYTKRPSFNIF